ncbi:DegV family protein [Alkalithermobacter paradoxus]|uniref:DegV domain-containing protein n=1 Tax=Alkalithermobacter paradoxus TaxID=29349 RepID=A0A1V4I692_9FIRM|nr:DegV domain-containing protein [[Clostridium] thermoalcaliphilum]
MAIKIITDSTAYIPKEYAKEHDIDVVQLTVSFNNEVMEEGYPGEFEDFFKKLKESTEFPKTSQPSTGAFVNAFEKAIKEGKEIITIVVSEKASGTYNNAILAAGMVDKDKISVIDSQTSGPNLRILVERAKELSNLGKCRKDIVDIINKEKKNMSVQMTFETLEYLKKGGRLSPSKVVIGSILNIKPIIGVENGYILPIGKARGKKKAIEFMINNIPDNVKKISVCHILSFEEAFRIKEVLKEKFSNAVINIDEVGPVLGAQFGPKGIGICCSW